MLKGYKMNIRTFTLFLALVTFFATGASAFDFGVFGGGPSKKVKGLVQEARGAYGSANYSKVIDLTNKAIIEDAKYAPAYALRGKAKKDTGDIDGAFKDLNKAIELDPKLGEAYYVRGQANEIMGEMGKAKADYEKGCEAGYRGAC